MEYIKEEREDVVRIYKKEYPNILSLVAIIFKRHFTQEKLREAIKVICDNNK